MLQVYLSVLVLRAFSSFIFLLIRAESFLGFFTFFTIQYDFQVLPFSGRCGAHILPLWVGKCTPQMGVCPRRFGLGPGGKLSPTRSPVYTKTLK
jgi:hypothetical protein